MHNHRVQKFLKNPKKALFSLAWPVLVGMLVQVLYNIVDTAFVGRLGAEAIAAITFSFPLFFLLIGINSGIGIGMGSRISRFLGENRKKEAENTAIHGLLLSVAVAVIVIAVGYFTLDPLFSLFGASEEVKPLALSYMRVILFSSLFMFPAFVMHSIFTSQGDTKTPVKIQVAALLLNIILDPIFIYVLDLGVQGAAIATFITFFFAMVLGLIYIHKRSDLHLVPANYHFSFPLIREIFSVGLSASLMMLTMSVYVIFLNRFMAHFSTEHVAAFGIASRLESIAVMPIMAISLSLLTLTGMFYGAKKYDLLKSTVWYGIKMSAFLTSVFGVVFFIFPTIFLRIFTNDPALLAISKNYLRIDVFTFPLMAIGQSISRVMQGMGYGLPGLVVNVIRIFVVAVPLAYVFVFMLGYGYLSIAVAMVIGGIVANLAAVPWLIIKFRKLD